MNNMSQLLDIASEYPRSNKNKFNAYTNRQIDKIPQLAKLPKETVFGIKVVSQVLPFRVNQYVIDELIDWDNWSRDPIFRLTFPQQEMLNEKDFSSVADHMNNGKSEHLQKEVGAYPVEYEPTPGWPKGTECPHF